MENITDHRPLGERGESDRAVRRGPVDLFRGGVADPEQPLSISCEDCSMQCSAACEYCVVTFLVGQSDEESLVLDFYQARVVRLLGKAGLVPDLKYRVAG